MTPKIVGHWCDYRVILRFSSTLPILGDGDRSNQKNINSGQYIPTIIHNIYKASKNGMDDHAIPHIIYRYRYTYTCQSLTMTHNIF